LIKRMCSAASSPTRRRSLFSLSNAIVQRFPWTGSVYLLGLSQLPPDLSCP
jgi:hypothetical protein